MRGLPQLFSALRLSGIRKHSGDFVNHSLYTRPSWLGRTPHVCHGTVLTGARTGPHPCRGCSQQISAAADGVSVRVLSSPWNARKARRSIPPFFAFLFVAFVVLRL